MVEEALKEVTHKQRKLAAPRRQLGAERRLRVERERLRL